MHPQVIYDKYHAVYICTILLFILISISFWRNSMQLSNACINFQQTFRGNETSQKYQRLSTKEILNKHGFALAEGAKLGYGRYSKVCKALHIRTGRNVIFLKFHSPIISYVINQWRFTWKGFEGNHRRRHL